MASKFRRYSVPLHTDQLGSVRVMTGADGALVIGGLITSSNNKISTGNIITDIAIGIAINNTVHSESNDDGEDGEVESDDDENSDYDNEDPSGGKNNRLGKDGDNQRQNSAFRAAVREVERQLNRSISKDGQRELHDHITGQDFTYGDIVDQAVDLLGD